ncbi:uncharacterized protein LOC126350317 [Schistocerca gregaria]|uniref:uncharacterized protein LOC126350317 n=1 Tax=Schistocerca gregaria TaxID=7010 RepID=UPI00211E3B83|nr:uncharacterized protein LOC126350317 [Schistocerca gregaria]
MHNGKKAAAAAAVVVEEDVATARAAERAPSRAPVAPAFSTPFFRRQVWAARLEGGRGGVGAARGCPARRRAAEKCKKLRRAAAAVRSASHQGMRRRLPLFEKRTASAPHCGRFFRIRRGLTSPESRPPRRDSRKLRGLAGAGTRVADVDALPTPPRRAARSGPGVSVPPQWCETASRNRCLSCCSIPASF